MRVIIVGAGGIARRHVDRLARIEGCKVVGVCDTDAGRASALARCCGSGVATESNPADLIGRIEADYLLLTTPRKVRLEVVKLCASAGLPVLMEKPPCHDRETGRMLVDFVEQSGILCAVGFMHRYHDALHWAANRIGGAEGLSVMHIAFTSPMAMRLPGSPWPSPYLLSESGGLIGDQGIHYADLARYLTNSEAEEVHAVLSRQRLPADPDITVDAAAWCLRMSGGQLVSHAHSWCANRWHCEIVLVGAAGRAVVDMFGNKATWQGESEEAEYIGSLDEFEAEHRAFHKALRSGDRTTIRSHPADALRSFELACRIQESAQG